MFIGFVCVCVLFELVGLLCVCVYARLFLVLLFTSMWSFVYVVAKITKTFLFFPSMYDYACFQFSFRLARLHATQRNTQSRLEFCRRVTWIVSFTNFFWKNFTKNIYQLMKLRHLPTKQSACILSSPPYEAISLYIIFTNSNSNCCFAHIHKYYYSANPFFKLFVPQQEFFVFVYT